MFRSTQKSIANNCGSAAARCLLSPGSPTSVNNSTQMRTFFTANRGSGAPEATATRLPITVVRPQSIRYFSSDENNNIRLGTSTTNSDINNYDNLSNEDERTSFVSNSSSRGPTPSALVSGSEYSNAVSASDHRDTAEKLWGTLYATPERLENTVTGSAGSSRITHNLNFGNARWQASCVEVRKKEKKNDENENPVIARRNKQFGALMPWEKVEADKTQNKFPKSDKFPAEDDVEIVFYFETHDLEGVGLSGYQSIAARVSDGELPGECSNLTAVGGFATWTVPRSEFVALTESKPLLGEMLMRAPPEGSETSKRGGKEGTNISEALRRVTIRMSTAEEQKKKYADATVL